MSKYVKPQITPSQGRQSPFRTPEIGFDQYDRLRENTARIDRQDLRSLFSVDGADRRSPPPCGVAARNGPPEETADLRGSESQYQIRREQGHRPVGVESDGQRLSLVAQTQLGALSRTHQIALYPAAGVGLLSSLHAKSDADLLGGQAARRGVLPQRIGGLRGAGSRFGATIWVSR